MSDIPDFESALSDFSRFLVRQGHSHKIVWVFRDDIWRRSRNLVWFRSSPPDENLPLAQKVYQEGRERGLVEIIGIAKAASQIIATVWFPKHVGEETSGVVGGA